MTCLHCAKETSNPKFCCKSCAAKYNNSKRKPRTFESKQKISQKIRDLFGYNSAPYIEKPTRKKHFTKASGPYTRIKHRGCTICDRQFWAVGDKKVCSDQCFIISKQRSVFRTPRIRYNNITFDSQWEVSLAKFLDSYGISWVRPQRALPWVDTNGKIHKYFPDFYLPDANLYVDPKNQYIAKIQHEKLTYIHEHYPNVIWGGLEFLYSEILSRLKNL